MSADYTPGYGGTAPASLYAGSMKDGRLASDVCVPRRLSFADVHEQMQKANSVATAIRERVSSTADRLGGDGELGAKVDENPLPFGVVPGLHRLANDLLYNMERLSEQFARIEAQIG